ncbi:hypothetical protein [Paracoccus sp. IB05]|uniref:hypothetical protein n=1 Tax=Paracoccus sp. IB05 TaxID=2779367 RepID=UPI0018E713D5|nr:hypothetical protein [Paracoccus sp. IB05]MBJ2153761.1 hypothetical protein [Paracoccus sp. IB05]
MFRASLALILLCSAPALAEGEAKAPGPVATLALALRLYDQAEGQGDALGMAVAARLAATIRQRGASHWERQSGNYAGPVLQGQEAAGLRATPDLLTSGAAWSGALLMAEEDEALSDLLYELPPPVLRGGVSQMAAELRPGREDRWMLPFAGQSPAEIAVFATEAESDAPQSDTGASDTGAGGALLWAVEDGAGGVLCPMRPVAANLCSFTPAENGFYEVVIANPAGGSAARAGAYLLVAN